MNAFNEFKDQRTNERGKGERDRERERAKNEGKNELVFADRQCIYLFLIL